MDEQLDDPRIVRILTPPGGDPRDWREALERLLDGDLTLTRRSVGEPAIKAVQRMLIYLGYSTSTTGAFSIDGDFGRGTNRGLAQFQFEHGLTRRIDREVLCYPCTWQTAKHRIVGIPDAKLDVASIEAMIGAALEATEAGRVMCGDFEVAIGFLNALHARAMLDCRQIRERYLPAVAAAADSIRDDQGVVIRAEWILAIIRQETAGIVRPRFEQHLLTRMHMNATDADFTELRFRAMSQGLGQVLGRHFRRVGAASALAMYLSPIDEQVLYVARYLARRPDSVGRRRPTAADYRAVAKYYNGPGYETHHYHERLRRWFTEFQSLADEQAPSG